MYLAVLALVCRLEPERGPVRGYHRAMEIGSVLFGAGRGERLRPLTDRVPKPALPLLDVPLAAWGLAGLARVAPPVVVNASHLAERLLGALEALELSGWEALVERPEAYGTAGTLAALRERIGPRLVTWNGDLLTDLDPDALIETHERVGALATLAVLPVESGADLVTAGDRVTTFVDRRRDAGAGGARFMGAAVFERAALERLPSERPAGLGETLLRELATSGDLAVHAFDGYWRDVGTVDAFRDASLDLLYERAPAAPVALPGQIVEVDGGRAYIGPGAEVTRDALGPGAIVLRGARVSAGASLTDSVVMPGSLVPPTRNTLAVLC